MSTLTGLSNSDVDWRKNDLLSAIEAVKTGRQSFAFASCLDDDTSAILEGLSLDDRRYLGDRLADEMNVPSQQRSRDDHLTAPTEPKNPETIELEKKLRSLIKGWMETGFKDHLSVRAVPSRTTEEPSGPHRWHIDSAPSWLDKEPRDYVLRVTLSLNGPTTQFILLTEEEKQTLSKIANIQERSDALQRMLENGRIRIQSGFSGDVCVFHSGTIHRSPPCRQERVVVTLCDEKTRICCSAL